MPSQISRAQAIVSATATASPTAQPLDAGRRSSVRALRYATPAGTRHSVRLGLASAHLVDSMSDLFHHEAAILVPACSLAGGGDKLFAWTNPC